MQWHTALAAGKGEGLELIPRGQQVAAVTQRQLQQSRTQLAGDCCQLVGSRDDIAGAYPGRQQCPLEVVEHPGPVLFVVQQMRQPRYDNVPATQPIAPDPQRRLLGHGATGEHHRSVLAEQRGDLALQGRDGTALTVAIPRWVGPVFGAV
jgi:hypothetical protein